MIDPCTGGWLITAGWITQMLKSPWLPQISSQLQSVLEAEQEKR